MSAHGPLFRVGGAPKETEVESLRVDRTWICDPARGTCGYVAAAAEHLRDNHSASCWLRPRTDERVAQKQRTATS
jgi:hypothetical protein